MINRQSGTWGIREDAIAIIDALKEASKDDKGVYAPNLPGLQPRRGPVSRYLRESGVALMARRSGHSSVWFIVSLFRDTDTKRRLAREWRRRAISDAYTEVCHQHMALSRDPELRDDCNVLASCAAMLGERLGYGLTEVSTDLKPSQMHSDIETALDNGR